MKKSVTYGMDKASCENMEIRKIVAKLVGLELSGLKLYSMHHDTLNANFALP